MIDVVAAKTYKLRGQAWVVFDNVASATAAVRGLQDFPFYDKPMRITYAKSKSDATAKLEGTYDPATRDPEVRAKRKAESQRAERERGEKGRGGRGRGRGNGNGDSHGPHRAPQRDPVRAGSAGYARSIPDFASRRGRSGPASVGSDREFATAATRARVFRPVIQPYTYR